KGIFDVGGGVYFLVSISDEAARNLELGAVRGRNEFNSSFYAVLRLPSLRPEQCAALLELRIPAFDHDIALAIGIMSGGVAREVVRLAERAVGGSTLESALHETLGEEVDAFLDQVLNAPRRAPDGDTVLGAAARLTAFTVLT